MKNFVQVADGTILNIDRASKFDYAIGADQLPHITVVSDGTTYDLIQVPTTFSTPDNVVHTVDEDDLKEITRYALSFIKKQGDILDNDELKDRAWEVFLCRYFCDYKHKRNQNADNPVSNPSQPSTPVVGQ